MFTNRRKKYAREWRDSNMNQPNDDDPIVAEVRRIVEEYTTKFGYDVKRVTEDRKRRIRELRALFGLHDKAYDRSNSAPGVHLRHS
jgi:hypothetical protein